MKIDSNLLVKEVYAAEREVRISCQEVTIDTCDQEVAVWRKQARHWKRTNEVGDGMELLRVHSRHTVHHKIDPVRFLYWLSARQEYDEENNLVVTYLYKFSKDAEDIAIANRLIQQILPGATIQINGRFVTLEWGVHEMIDLNQLDETLLAGWITACLSLLRALIVVYGTIAQEENIIHTCTIHLPLLWPLAQRNDLIQLVLRTLRDYGIYTTQHIMNQREGQLLQISIADRELLEYIAQALRGVSGELKVGKMEICLQQKNNLLEFLSQHSAPAQIITAIEDSVLKTVRK